MNPPLDRFSEHRDTFLDEDVESEIEREESRGDEYADEPEREERK